MNDDASPAKSPVSNYKMVLSYRGTDFNGFQSQTDGRAVQDHLEKSLQVFLRHPVRVKGASRTDTGVHAQGQTAVFSSPRPFDGRWLISINAILSKGISVKSIEPVSHEFHPSFQAKAKAYRYRIHQGRIYDPFVEDFIWELYFPIDLDLLKAAVEKFVGRKDFAAFCNQGSYARTTVRRIIEVKVDIRGKLVDIWFLGEGFLKQMVRIMVGTAIEVAQGKRPLSDIDRLFEEKDRKQSGQTAPAKGLSLVEIFYQEIPCLDGMIQKAQTSFCHIC